MGNKEATSNFKTVFWVVFLATLMVGSVIFFQSQLAKERGLDVLFDLFAKVILLVALLAILQRNWHTARIGSKVVLGFLIACVAFFAISGLINDWPRLPWVKAEAFHTADTFLTDMQANDTASVWRSFTHRMQQCVKLEDLTQPDAQPISWELHGMDAYTNIHGTAIFADGQALSLTVRMLWDERQWRINGFWFGSWDDGKLDYSSMHCGE